MLLELILILFLNAPSAIQEKPTYSFTTQGHSIAVDSVTTTKYQNEERDMLEIKIHMGSSIACENDDWCYMRIKCRAANGKHYFRDKGQDDQNQVTFKAPGTQLYGREDYSGKDYWIEISELNTENKTFNILIETSTFFIRDIIVFPEPAATFRGENLRYTE